MAPEVLSCPYCNARFALAAGEGGSPRVRCPRCGDSFPHHAGQDVRVNGTPPPGPPASPPAPAPTVRASNRTVARAVLGVMAGMAVIGLAYALYTQSFRRANDQPKGRPGALAPLVRSGPRATPPAELAGLGYLPADSAVVAGLHLAELRRDPDGKTFLEKLRSSPARPLLLLAQDWTGLRLEEIDHVVLGISPGGGQPRLFVVVRTARPYSPKALVQALGPARPRTFRGRPVYTIPVGPVGTGLVYAASENTLILCTSLLPAQLGDLDVLPEKARTGADRLPSSVRDLLKHKLERGSLAWAVGALDEVPFLQDFVQLSGAEELARGVSNLKAFTVGIRFPGGVTVGAALQGKDDKAAQELTALLKKHPPQGVASFQVRGPDQGWVLVQVRASAEALADWSARLAAAAPAKGER